VQSIAALASRSKDILCRVPRLGPQLPRYASARHQPPSDPECTDLLCERIRLAEAPEPPDIDVYFPRHERREIVMQWLFWTPMAVITPRWCSTVIRYRAKGANPRCRQGPSAIPEDLIKGVVVASLGLVGEVDTKYAQERNLNLENQRASCSRNCGRDLIGRAADASVSASVPGRYRADARPLDELVSVEPGAMAERQVIDGTRRQSIS